jgi:hypothetical protein
MEASMCMEICNCVMQSNHQPWDEGKSLTATGISVYGLTRRLTAVT